MNTTVTEHKNKICLLMALNLQRFMHMVNFFCTRGLIQSLLKPFGLSMDFRRFCIRVSELSALFRMV